LTASAPLDDLADRKRGDGGNDPGDDPEGEPTQYSDDDDRE
jgi:hypothetical protein